MKFLDNYPLLKYWIFQGSSIVGGFVCCKYWYSNPIISIWAIIIAIVIGLIFYGD